MEDLKVTIDLNHISVEHKRRFSELIDEILAETKENKPLEKKSFNPFERVHEGGNYYYIDYSGNVDTDPEFKCTDDDDCFGCHNYFNDKEFAKHQALRELLNRKLIKFSYENGGADIKHPPEGYTICIEYSKNADESSDRLKIGINYCMTDILTPVFVSGEVAERAIDEVIKPFLKEHPDFKWWG